MAAGADNYDAVYRRFRWPKLGEFNYDSVLTEYAKWESALKIPGVKVIDLHTAMTKEVSIQTIKRSNHNDSQASALIAAGKIPDSFVTHHWPLEKTPDAFEMLTGYTDQVGKVIIQL